MSGKRVRIKGTGFVADLIGLSYSGSSYEAEYQGHRLILPAEICEVVYEPAEHTYSGKVTELRTVLHGDDVFFHAIDLEDTGGSIGLDLGKAQALKLAADIHNYYQA